MRVLWEQQGAVFSEGSALELKESQHLPSLLKCPWARHWILIGCLSVALRLTLCSDLHVGEKNRGCFYWPFLFFWNWSPKNKNIIFTRLSPLGGQNAGSNSRQRLWEMIGVCWFAQGQSIHQKKKELNLCWSFCFTQKSFLCKTKTPAQDLAAFWRSYGILPNAAQTSAYSQTSPEPSRENVNSFCFVFCFVFSQLSISKMLLFLKLRKQNFLFIFL